MRCDFCEILRKYLSGESLDEDIRVLDYEGFDALFKMSLMQNLVSVLFDVVDSVDVKLLPFELRMRWGLVVKNEENDYFKKQKVLKQLAGLYAEHGIKMLVLKGVGIGRYYPRPDHRFCGDIDIFLFGKQKEADKLLADKFGVRVHNDVHLHSVFAINGVRIENHFDFVDTSVHRSSVRLNKFLMDISNSDCVESDNPNIFYPSPTFNAIFLMRHMAGHFAAKEINLRHLLDWYFFMKNESDKVDWKIVLEIFKDLKMDRFFMCINTVVVRYLGLQDNCFFEQSDDEAMVDRVYHEILQPEFGKNKPQNGSLRIILFKLQRFKANTWKRRLVYGEGDVEIFLRSTLAHFIKPKTLLK